MSEKAISYLPSDWETFDETRLGNLVTEAFRRGDQKTRDMLNARIATLREKRATAATEPAPPSIKADLLDPLATALKKGRAK